MRHLILSAAAIGLLVALPVQAQSQPDSEDARYSFHRADEGYLRLDQKTGEVALCVRRQPGWVCQVVPDERAALDVEIGRLQAENGALKQELLAHHLPLPQGTKAEPAPDQTGGISKLRLPNNGDVLRVVNFFGEMWQRLVEVVARLQSDILKKT